MRGRAKESASRPEQELKLEPQPVLDLQAQLELEHFQQELLPHYHLPKLDSEKYPAGMPKILPKKRVLSGRQIARTYVHILSVHTMNAKKKFSEKCRFSNV